ncbi:glycoside hydrolase family 16 protein [Gigaspora margarita]|uniref:Glycoside hydrolase family 16 protein n=1 Tax=Gigaspora margarita TaxID=4874 RepID=A0A8H4EIW0_GIGMA|nr:glycoside hydrolase family 16 protein [Gigaspora margarita]
MVLYSPDMITTKDGKLQITIINEIIHESNYTSGMLQSWNKICFQGVILEVSASLPGDGKTQGFWPAIWTLSNLSRAAMIDGVWPYNYDECDVGITPINPYIRKGRGVPEIDLLETIDDDGQNCISQSTYFAPFNANRTIIKDLIYINNPNVTSFNTYVGGVVVVPG